MTLDLVDDLAVAPALADDVAVVMLTHVNYRTGALHDMVHLNALAKAKGILTVWDLAHSAGAVPGPAAYGKGGTEPTVTDANLVLGRLDKDDFLGGGMKLDVAAAERAIQAKVGRPLNLSVKESASRGRRGLRFESEVTPGILTGADTGEGIVAGRATAACACFAWAMRPLLSDRMHLFDACAQKSCKRQAPGRPGNAGVYACCASHCIRACQGIMAIVSISLPADTRALELAISWMTARSLF